MMAHGKLQIGWARTDITPLRKTLVLGQFRTRISDEVLNPLTATALALEVRDGDGGTEQAVIISCDLAICTFKNDLLQALDGRCPDLDAQKITLSCTHTHTGPATDSGFYDEPEDDPEFLCPDEYRGWLAAQLADLVETAWAKRTPGSLSRGFAYATVGHCRRAVYADGTGLMYGDTNRPDIRGLESCSDPSVNMLFTRGPAGELTGMLVNLACTSQCQEHMSVFSADYWHHVREAIAERHGDGVHLLPQCAPAGDMSPHLLYDKTEEADLRNRLGVDKCGIITRRIMAAVDEGLATASPPEGTLTFAHDVATWQLPRLMVTQEEYELEKSIYHMSEEERAQQHYAFQKIWRFGDVCELISRYENQGENAIQEMESHVIRLGAVVFATNAFELYVDYAMRIRSRSRALQTFLVQIADGCGFYLPTQRALDHGHYSAQIKSCWVGPEGGQVLVDNTVAAIDRLFADEDYPKTR